MSRRHASGPAGARGRGPAVQHRRLAAGRRVDGAADAAGTTADPADQARPRLAGARSLAAGLPHCLGVTELPGLGHMTPIEAPELVTGRIRELVTAYGRDRANPRADTDTQVKEGA